MQSSSPADLLDFSLDTNSEQEQAPKRLRSATHEEESMVDSSFTPWAGMGLPSFAHEAVEMLQPGQLIQIGMLQVLMVVITIPRNFERAKETVAHAASVLYMDTQKFAIAQSIDGSQYDIPGKFALFMFYRDQLLQQLPKMYPLATHFLFLEDDVRLDASLGTYLQGTGTSHFTRIIHLAAEFVRPIILMGFNRKPITVQYQHRKPDFGMHLWFTSAMMLPVIGRLLHAWHMEHTDMYLLKRYPNLIGYTRYSIAGFISHVSDCADPHDKALKDGVRDGMEVNLSKDDYKEMALIEYFP